MRTVTVLLAALAVLGLARPAAAAVYEDVLTADASQAEELYLEHSFLDFDLRVVSGDEVRAEVYIDFSVPDEEEFLERFRPVIERQGDRIIITRNDGRRNYDWGRRTKIKKAVMEVTVPRHLEVEIDTASGDIRFVGDLDNVLNVDTASGDIGIDGSAHEFHLDTASGDITAELSRATRDFRANTASGDIRLTGGADRVHADTASGDIEVDGLRGSARFSAASGDIRARWSRAESGIDVEASTASGDVVIVLPDGVEVEGYADTASGDIESDFRGSFNRDRDHLRWEGGRNAVRLELDTASGDVSVRAE